MALKENYVLWDEAVCLSSRGEHENGLRKFKQVLDPSSKILFNIGCLQMLLGRNEEAVMSFSQTVDKDQHLAVGYFQRGVGNLKCSRYQHAVQDFRSACDKLRDNKHIDYKQLGLKYKLYQSEILHNMALAYANLKNFDKASSLLQVVLSSCSSDDINHDFIDKAIEKVKRKEIPDFAVCLPKDALFKPSKSVISNLQKKDYLGKAKVISSLEHDDTFSGFIGAKKQASPSISTSLPSSPIGGRKKHGPPSKEVVDFLEKQIQVGPPKKPPPPNYAPPQLPLQMVIPGTAIQRSRFQRGVAGTASSPPKLRVKKGRNVANEISHKPVTMNPSLPNTFEDLNVKISPPKPPRTFEHTLSAGNNLMETVERKSEILPRPVPEPMPASPKYLERLPSSPENEENSEYFDMNCGPRKCTYDNPGAPASKPLLNNSKQTNGRKPPPKQILPPRPSKFDKNEGSDRYIYPENPASSVKDVQQKFEASKLELEQRKENDRITGNEQSKKLSKKPPPPRKPLPARPPPVTQKGGSISDDDHEYIYPGMYTANAIMKEGEKESLENGEFDKESDKHDNKNKNPQVPIKPNHITRKRSIIVTFVNEEKSRTTPVSFGSSFAYMQQKVCDLLNLKKEKISLWCHTSTEHKLIKCESSMQQVWDSMSANRSETLKIWAKPK